MYDTFEGWRKDIFQCTPRSTRTEESGTETDSLYVCGSEPSMRTNDHTSRKSENLRATEGKIRRAIPRIKQVKKVVASQFESSQRREDGI